MPARRKILLPVCAAIVLGITAARAEPLPWPRPPGPDGSFATRADGRSQVARRLVPLGLDVERRFLSQKWR
jgi:hypothetical protein